ncbi:MAG: hypothetical protein KIH06_05150 [Kiritimatiellae bacterium]|nr:hypothetical protein [Kiritimatiellia bacterium]
MNGNTMMIVMAVVIVGCASGCCWFKCESCPKEKSECCEKQCGIGVKANVGGASAGAGMSTRGAHAEATLGK